MMRSVDLSQIISFVHESNMIEDIHRRPLLGETSAMKSLLMVPRSTGLSVADVCAYQRAITPGKPLRDRAGLDVVVGRHRPIYGGPAIPFALESLLLRVSDRLLTDQSEPWKCHALFEELHPFMDGNGRTGRAVWAWHMLRLGLDPFRRPFLHEFYYQTLDGFRRFCPATRELS